MRLASILLSKNIVFLARPISSRSASFLAPNKTPIIQQQQLVPMPSAVIRRSPSASPPPAKRQKVDHGSISDGVPVISKAETPRETESINDSTAVQTLKSALNYRDGVMLAPMVRSGTLPSRLLALKYGADLVWGPEVVDKGMLGCSRVVDEETGVITYEKAGKPVWSTHPIEKPYLIYQIGSASPDLAAQSALMVSQDVSGVELNCGCPKPFSTHAGMGANLLSTPDLLCDILIKLRTTLPQSIAVSAKIRLLPSQENTLALVKKIVSTGISCLTVHCRTKDMRKREPALIHRLREIVEYVEGMNLGIPVIANGDCSSRDDAVRLRDVTGAHSVMIATAAERNLSCFTPGRPLLDAETELAPTYFALARYLKNPWGNSKHCIAQFSSPPRPVAVRTPLPRITGTDTAIKPRSGGGGSKDSLKDFKQRLHSAKDYDMFADFAIDGEEVFDEVKRVLARRSFPTEPVAHMGALSGTECSYPGPVPPCTEECESHQSAALDPPRVLDKESAEAAPSPPNYVTGDTNHRIALAV